jgi:ATP-dependent Clp protease ATP-binding subunit ClpC
VSYIFRRYPEPSRRVIFYAREAALYARANEIDSMHLLAGLLVEPSNRAARIFHLADRFPEESARMRSLKIFPEPRILPLTRDCKRILAFAEKEADRLDDYWIDTDHLLLGILRQPTCAAAARAAATGLKIDEARKQVGAASEERESYGAVPALWRLAKPITRIGHFAGVMYLLLIFVLIKLLSGRGC